MERLFDLLFVNSLKGVGKKTLHRKYLSAIINSCDTEDLITNYIPRIKAYSQAELTKAQEDAKARLDELQRLQGRKLFHI